ncbi:hypothetical protein GDO81_029128 [Engystomops pustulosus]|uniref:Toll-like receptor 4 n=1 Tax=Engystomops pustulosus TaxID=76066 RepID=A0AAV6ZLN7_ENGPU|nr:hypothetical protein GDO81_029128 [Engystomops pustulosus]
MCLYFRFNECTLQINNLKSLESVIRDSISLTELSLSRTNLGDTGVQIVSNFQTLLPNLKIIKLASVNMSDIGMVHLTESLTHCKSVEDIDLSSNAIGEKGRQSLIRLLMQRRNFHAVNVCDCGFSMTSEEGKMFLSQLSKSPNLQKINLQNMSLDDSSLLLLCQALPRLLSIRKLILSFNGIGDVNMAFLPNLKCLKKIKLSQCNISTVGGLNLATTLQQCPLVEEIDLSGNNFENKTTSHLFTALSQVKHLKVLQ